MNTLCDYMVGILWLWVVVVLPFCRYTREAWFYKVDMSFYGNKIVIQLCNSV